MKRLEEALYWLFTDLCETLEPENDVRGNPSILDAAEYMDGATGEALGRGELSGCTSRFLGSAPAAADHFAVLGLDRHPFVTLIRGRSCASEYGGWDRPEEELVSRGDALFELLPSAVVLCRLVFIIVGRTFSSPRVLRNLLHLERKPRFDDPRADFDSLS